MIPRLVALAGTFDQDQTIYRAIPRVRSRLLNQRAPSDCDERVLKGSANNDESPGRGAIRSARFGARDECVTSNFPIVRAAPRRFVKSGDEAATNEFHWHAYDFSETRSLRRDSSIKGAGRRRARRSPSWIFVGGPISRVGSSSISRRRAYGAMRRTSGFPTPGSSREWRGNAQGFFKHYRSDTPIQRPGDRHAARSAWY